MPSLTIPIANRLRFPAIVDGSQVSGVRYFFVDDPAYFDRDGLYGNSAGDYPDNAERYSEFCRAAIEIVKQVWPADVIHCHDWQTALVPVLLRTSYGDDPAVKDLPVVFTIHNMGYHGLFRREVLERAGIPVGVYHPAGAGIFRQREFPEGRADLFRFSDDRQQAGMRKRFRRPSMATDWTAWCGAAPTG